LSLAGYLSPSKDLVDLWILVVTFYVFLPSLPSSILLQSLVLLIYHYYYCCYERLAPLIATLPLLLFSGTSVAYRWIRLSSGVSPVSSQTNFLLRHLSPLALLFF
jgi:hypothetical protein